MRRRRNSALLVMAGLGAIAVAILVIEYRLMVIAFVVLFPGLIVVIDAVMVSKAARALGPVEVRCEGTWLVLNSKFSVPLEAVIAVRVQPDAVVIAERLNERRWRTHVIPTEGDAFRPLVRRLEGLGRKVIYERSPVPALVAGLAGLLTNLMLAKLAAVLVLVAVVLILKPAFERQWPGWEAYACLGGALVALTLKALIDLMLPKLATAPVPEPATAPSPPP